MQAKAGLWVLGGAVAATGVLVASPRAYDAIRRRTPFVRDSIFGVEEYDVPAEEAPADAVDMREARLSLRARLAEANELAGDEPGSEEPPRTPRPLRRERIDSDEMRTAVDEARARVLRKARAAGLD
jgi:hypothetical protein